MNDAELLSRATEFTFLPAGASPGEPDVDIFSVKVTWRGPDLWAVQWMGQCYGPDGWVYEPSPSNRTKTFLATHRYTAERAVELAQSLVETISINGSTWADAEARRAARLDSED